MLYNIEGVEYNSSDGNPDWTYLYVDEPNNKAVKEQNSRLTDVLIKLHYTRNNLNNLRFIELLENIRSVV